ncbi:MAG TPA: accessory factor UbiK family protein [Alphaproteobacteria bacterium]|nr:accessory factor UbiK family protein [Alphaproteobacteria bacterium]
MRPSRDESKAPMVGDRRLFDDMARVASGAAVALGGIRSRMEGELRDQVERLLQRMNLVTREEHEVVAALAAKARTEQEALARRVAALEAKLAATRPSGATRRRSGAEQPLARPKTVRSRAPGGKH